ncbi:MAG: Ig-like domain-containing protein [Thermoplasmatota archaeon]
MIRINRNRFIGCPDAVYVQSLLVSEFRDNEIVDCPGIGLNYGGMFWVTENNQITGNVFINCSLAINGSQTESDDLLNNRFIDCGTGAYFYMMGEMLLHNNTFINSVVAGIDLHSSCGGNTLYENWFINNTLHARDGGSQYWYKDGRGNYWSGLVGFYDNNADGIYDKPYWLDGNSVDRYPLVGLPGCRINEPATLGDLPERTVFVGEWMNITFQASDPDDDDLYFEVSTDPGITFSLDRTTGEFSYLAAAQDVGLIDVGVSVTDNNGSRDEGEFSLEVLFRNLPPEVEQIPDMSALPGARKLHQLRFSDPNGDKVSVSVESTETPFSVQINSHYQVSFMAIPGQEGDYRVVLNFSDNNGSFTRVAFRIVILHSNRAPVIVNIEDQKVAFGKEFTYQVVVIEDDPDTLTYSLQFSGSGQASIGGSGLIRIVPVNRDIGNRTVVVEVDDNNGSQVSETFTLWTYVDNRPPVVPENMRVRVEAGDVMKVHFDVSDPEGNAIFIFPNDEMPAWVEVREDDLSMILRPRMEHIGDHDFKLTFLDRDNLGGTMNVDVIVVGTEFPTWPLPGRIDMDERETLVLDLDPGYPGNGTVWYRFDDLRDFMDRAGSRLSISPEDGDEGEYLIGISYGIINGSEVDPRTLRIVVHRNLSSFWFGVILVPDREAYDLGSVIGASCEWGGYNGTITLKWVWEVEGSVYSRVEGDMSSVRVNFSGTWNLTLLLEGNEAPLYSKSFRIRGDDDDDDDDVRFYGSGAPSWAVALVIILIILVLSVGGSLFYIKFRKLYHEWDQDKVGMNTGGPAEVYTLRMPPSMMGSEEFDIASNSGNDYTEGDGLTPHDASYLRGEEVPEKSSQAGFRQG